ncbi:MAG: hypothetical protein M3270_10685 [Thermoproteota archaeon]|nr:hypothetical protein [Thermoproteota archaeon]
MPSVSFFNLNEFDLMTRSDKTMAQRDSAEKTSKFGPDVWADQKRNNKLVTVTFMLLSYEIILHYQ